MVKAWGGKAAWLFKLLKGGGKGALLKNGGKGALPKSGGKGGKAVKRTVGKGGGKGFSAVKPVDKFKEKLRTIDSSLKVWVGGLSKKVTWKDLENHFAKISKPSVVDVGGKGTGVVAFKSEEDVGNAIASLQGTKLCGSIINVDVWVKKDKTDGEKVKKPRNKIQKKQLKIKSKQNQRTPFLQKAAALQKKKKGAVDQKTKERLDKIDASLKVFIGGLPKGIEWKDLEKFVASKAKKPSITDIRPKHGRACLAYKDEGDVADAISSLNGATFKGKVLEADVWVKPEKKV